jgi:uncharacterized membrane protein
MIVVHFCENLAGYTPFIAGFGAPMFMFLSGVSYRLWLNGQRKRSQPSSEIKKVSVRRGLFLIGLGFVFNILVWSPEEAFNWDILTLIGTGLIVLSLVRNIPSIALVLLCSALVLVAPVVQQLADYPSYWTEDYFDPDWSFSDISLGFLVTGYFPLTPWIAFPMIGFAVANKLFNSTSNEASTVPNSQIWFILRIGLILICISGGLLLARKLVPESIVISLPNPWTMFPPSLEYSVGIIGFTVSSFVLTHYWIDHKFSTGALDRIAKFSIVFGKHSLSFYLLHHLIHLWPLWIYGSIFGEHFQDFWMKATNVSVALILASIFLIISFYLFRWIDRHDGPSAEKLMRWLCD